MRAGPGRRSFWGRRFVGVMADRGQHGEGHHDERDVAMPAVPGTRLVVVETEFVLGRLEPVLDGPATAFHGHESFERRAERAPGREEGHRPVGDGAADEKATCPRARRPIELPGVEISEIEVMPVVQPRALGVNRR